MDGLGAREDAGDDVGQVEHLEEPLKGPVFAHGALHHREDDLVAARAERLGEKSVELQADDAVTRLGEGLGDAERRSTAHLGLGRWAALDDGDGQAS